jgi:hypothetical protein
MTSTLSVLADVQLRRANAFPAKVADNPLRALLLDTVQRRNATLDALFYDVGVVTEAETHDLAFWLAREGAILKVTPSGYAPLQVCLTKEDFFAAGGAECAALAVAGVGSSALGAAAFARNVADALGKPVAAVVSGYGLADVMTEAVGGFFWFGGLNSIRHAFEGLDELTKRFTLSEPPRVADSDWLQLSRDTATVIALLEDRRFTADLLIGHSKGNLVISEALYAIEDQGSAALRTRARKRNIVTVSAKIGMPPAYRRVIDVMGQWDGFGALNSRPDIPADYIVPGAWHSTNPDFPLSMGIRVGKMLRAVLPMFDEPLAAPTPAGLSPLVDAPQLITAARALPAH